MATIHSVIDGKYEILKEIGRGGMSKVYLAMDKNLNKQWAVKEIQKTGRDANNDVVIQSAIAEANLMKKLDHPCLPRIVDILDYPDVIYVIMDYIEGLSLNKVLEQQGAQPQDVVIEWARDLCDVLGYLHSQNPPIIYRDMKPANIMLQPNGNIKLIDFGIAREYKATNIEDTQCLGTKGYAAPEQFGGRGQTDGRTDIYCLGVTLYHIITGKNPSEPPYEIYPIRYWDENLSTGLEAIIEQCTKQNPEDRYQSCEELQYALDHYDEADGAYHRQLKGKMTTFVSVAAAAVICLAAGIGTRIGSINLNNNDYSNFILQAKNSSSVEAQIQAYEEAIERKPMAIEAYMGIINAFKDDAAFTVEEEGVLKRLLNANLSELQKQEQYSELAFEIGKLYWYYYDYGNSNTSDNQTTRMKSATQWFEDTCTYGDETADYYMIAEAYRNIGDFTKNITLKVEEASDKGEYGEYFESLQTINEKISEDTNEIVCLEVYKLTVNSIGTYARKFMNDGITKEQQLELLNNAIEAAKKQEATTDKTTALKEDILSSEATAKQVVEGVYTNSSVEGTEGNSDGVKILDLEEIGPSQDETEISEDVEGGEL